MRRSKVPREYGLIGAVVGLCVVAALVTFDPGGRPPTPRHSEGSASVPAPTGRPRDPQPPWRGAPTPEREVERSADGAAFIEQIATILGGHVLRCDAPGLPDQDLTMSLATPPLEDFPSTVLGQIRGHVAMAYVPDEPGEADWEGAVRGVGSLEWTIVEGRAACVAFRVGPGSRHPDGTGDPQAELCRYWRGQAVELRAMVVLMANEDDVDTDALEALRQGNDDFAAQIEDDFCRGM